MARAGPLGWACPLWQLQRGCDAPRTYRLGPARVRPEAGPREPAFMHARRKRGLLLVLQCKRADCGTAGPVIAALC